MQGVCFEASYSHHHYLELGLLPITNSDLRMKCINFCYSHAIYYFTVFLSSVVNLLKVAITTFNSSHQVREIAAYTVLWRETVHILLVRSTWTELSRSLPFIHKCLKLNAILHSLIDYFQSIHLHLNTNL